jgi:acyl-CoA thioester hydrolase
MGVVYHARYVVWLDMARTEHLREAGYSYKELEDQGVRLVVTDLRIRYAGPARYDDLVRIRCRASEVASRKVVFEYVIEHAESGAPLATAETTLVCLDRHHKLSRLPSNVVEALSR